MSACWARTKRKLCTKHSKVTAYQPEDSEATATLGLTRGSPPHEISPASQRPILAQAELVKRPIDEDAGNDHPELMRHSVRELRTQAERLGIEREKIEDARDADDPKVRGNRRLTR